MSSLPLIAADLVAVSILAVAVYFPRYRRRDMLVAIVGINVGVMAVTTALANAEVTAGLGLGLFGVLSIIRLRSDELAQEEIAYYFSALALCLLAGFPLEPDWLGPALMAVIVTVLFVADHPALFADSRHQTMTLDGARTDEALLRHDLEQLLGGRITRVKVKRVDMVNNTTTVDVRYRLSPDADRAAESPIGPSHEQLASWS